MIKVSFSPNEKVKITESLYQWDFGQKLEIESADLPSVFEVHFSCNGMSEAVIVPCGGGNSKIVDIPDVCLEQPSAITAWVYVVGDDGARGSTQKTITIPVSARMRPGRTQNVPQTVTNEYTKLISEVNDLVDDLTEGNITAKNATNAANATSAVSATNANFANMAQKATNADAATVASVLLVKPSRNLVSGLTATSCTITTPGLYLVSFLLHEVGRLFTSFVFVPNLDIPSNGLQLVDLSDNGVVVPYYETNTKQIRLSSTMGGSKTFYLSAVYKLGDFGEAG